MRSPIDNSERQSLARHALVLVGDVPVARTLAAHCINLPVLPSVVVTSISALWPTVGVMASDQVFDSRYGIRFTDTV